MSVKASICIATYDKPFLLEKVLESIYYQTPSFEFETIVVDDGSLTEDTRNVCEKFPQVVYHRIDRVPSFRNPCTARNVAYRLAKGEILIPQSDEVVHVTSDAIERLVQELSPGRFVIANVFCLNPNGVVCGCFTGPPRQRPYFFLGSIYKSDLYAVGGNDEEFACGPAWEDTWFGDCLLYGLRLKPVFTTNIIGHHLYHETRSNPAIEIPSKTLYFKKRREAMAGKIPWCSSGGPWSFFSNEAEATFTSIYKSNTWGNEESHSGFGSTYDATKEVRESLPCLFKEYNIQSMLDIPCGDFNWMQHTNLCGIQYIGADIVKELVEANTKQFYNGQNNIQFLYADLLSSSLPCVDLVLCRDCLQHFKFVDVKRAINNIVQSGSRYLLATTFLNRVNKDMRTGDWRPYALMEPPFNFPTPIAVINEHCQESYPQFTDKSLGLWEISSLKGIMPNV